MMFILNRFTILIFSQNFNDQIVDRNLKNNFFQIIRFQIDSHFLLVNKLSNKNLKFFKI